VVGKFGDFQAISRRFTVLYQKLTDDADDDDDDAGALTFDVQVDGLNVWPQPGHCSHAFQVGLIILRPHTQCLRPALRPVVDRPQTAQSRHGRRVVEPEVICDVTLAHVDVQARRWIAAERDAAQRTRLVFHRSQDIRCRHV